MIRGNNINLRHINYDDLIDIHNLKNDLNEAGKHAVISIKSFNKLEKMYKEHGMITKDMEMMLITNKKDRIVGMIQRAKQQSYSTGYELGFSIFKKSDRRKGYAYEALNLFTSYVFESNPIERLELGTHINNIGAQKLAEKCGYSLEGINRKACFIRGEVVDLKRYSIVREEVKDLSEYLKKE